MKTIAYYGFLKRFILSSASMDPSVKISDNQS